MQEPLLSCILGHFGKALPPKTFEFFLITGPLEEKPFPAFLSGRGVGMSIKLFFVAAFKENLIISSPQILSEVAHLLYNDMHTTRGRHICTCVYYRMPSTLYEETISVRAIR